MALSNSTVSKPDYFENCCAVTTEYCVLPTATTNETITYATVLASLGFTVGTEPIAGIKAIKATLLYKGSETSTLATPVVPTTSNAVLSYKGLTDNLDAGNENLKDAGNKIGAYLDTSWSLEIIPGTCVQLDITVASAPEQV
jgi:hypothetical protein